MVSIIIPVYNAESFLEKAVESVFRQSYKDWEIILIDDGSTDSSGIICDSLANQHDNIKVAHISNGGQSHARNHGLDMAEGSHIIFLDADDILPPDTLKITYDCFLKSGCDVVCGTMQNFSEEDELKSVDRSPSEALTGNNYFRMLSPEDAMLDILYQKRLDNSVCGKLFTARIWKELRFREGTGYEDLDAICPAIMRANRVAVLKDWHLYFYRQHQGSYIHTFNLRRCDVLDVTRRLTATMESHYPRLAPAARSRELSANFNMLTLLAANSTSPEARALSDRCWIRIKELRGESLRNPSVRLKNKIGIVCTYIGGRRLVEILGKALCR